ncbi:hypothetical protein [Rhizosaccharibacter radicis]|uniref:Uncharacterized protein n=1 Tax=Rhizosaccharibacter radicis TaxID=2782605 RepID=A0ABT1W0S1_9PROT|nr:hypothetical protein [Acetobacteraceae bacterium KSS12]
MKKLSAKQRARRPAPARRKVVPGTPTPPRERDETPDIGWVVRLPDEPNPHAPAPERTLVPAYVGWRGRALHIQRALLFDTRKAASLAAGPFRGSTVERHDIWKKDSPCRESWLTVALPDVAAREAFGMSPAWRHPVTGETEDEFYARVEPLMTLADGRAPQADALARRTVEWIRDNTPMTFKLGGLGEDDAFPDRE